MLGYFRLNGAVPVFCSGNGQQVACAYKAWVCRNFDVYLLHDKIQKGHIQCLEIAVQSPIYGDIWIDWCKLLSVCLFPYDTVLHSGGRYNSSECFTGIYFNCDLLYGQKASKAD